jgi:D-alanyl-D-alanine carboxypeptidase/D-alanyl-D-alanine-endopeptidase (penicillin-binding protein 4)
MRRFRLTLGALVVLILTAAGAAAARPPAAQRALTAALSQGMRNLGGASGAYVVDLDTGQPLFSSAAGVGRVPASVEKLYTTSTALLRYGPNATLATTVRGIGSVDSSGVFHGTLYLVGGGDPTFGSRSFDHTWYGTGATMQRLVANLVSATGITAVKGAIVADESYFDSRRGTPPTGYAPDLPDVEGQLSALAYNRGFADLYGSVAQPRPALYAADQFAVALKAAGVAAPARIYTGRAPNGANVLANVHSSRIATLIQLTNAPSDNFLAEMLLKGLGARFGASGSTASGAAVVRAELASQFGLTPRLNDGSGLSRSDSTTPVQVVTLLTKLASNRAFRSSLAIAGETGTLKDEAKGTAAQGACVGKTGTLHDVANLAGYCRARDGHTLAFAFLANALSDPDYVHAVEADDMAAAVARYDG